ncbi:hypothetical protein BH09MYX1_BH09MYX1_13470 [soil metagenome]
MLLVLLHLPGPGAPTAGRPSSLTSSVAGRIEPEEGAAWTRKCGGRPRPRVVESSPSVGRLRVLPACYADAMTVRLLVVAAMSVTIVVACGGSDDPVVPGGFACGPFTDNGCPPASTCVSEECDPTDGQLRGGALRLARFHTLADTRAEPSATLARSAASSARSARRTRTAIRTRNASPRASPSRSASDSPIFVRLSLPR